LPVQLDIAVSEVEELVYVLGRQALDTEEVAVPERSVADGSLHAPGTISAAPPPGKPVPGSA